jgi:hypothetical protein
MASGGGGRVLMTTAFPLTSYTSDGDWSKQLALNWILNFTPRGMEKMDRSFSEIVKVDGRYKCHTPGEVIFINVYLCFAPLQRYNYRIEGSLRLEFQDSDSLFRPLVVYARAGAYQALYHVYIENDQCNFKCWIMDQRDIELPKRYADYAPSVSAVLYMNQCESVSGETKWSFDQVKAYVQSEREKVVKINTIAIPPR